MLFLLKVSVTTTSIIACLVGLIISLVQGEYIFALNFGISLVHTASFGVLFSLQHFVIQTASTGCRGGQK